MTFQNPKDHNDGWGPGQRAADAPIVEPVDFTDGKVLKPDAAAIEAFLSKHIGYAIHLATIDPNIEPDPITGEEPPGKIRGRYFGDDAAAAAKWGAEENADGRNLYFTVNVVKAGFNRTKPNKSDIVAARFVYCDKDPPFELNAMLASMKEGIEPSLIIHSGNGLQPLWRLDTAPGPSERENIEAINRAIETRFNADNCHNIDRLLRVPGAINYPNAKKRSEGRKPVMASVMHVGSGDRIHRMADIVKAFPPIFKKERQKVQGLNYEWSGELFTANDFLGNSVIHDKHNLRALINPLVEGDMSTKGVACACAMIRAGLTFEHVAGVLLNCSNTVSSHYLRQGDPERAARRAYEWAMENVAKSAEKEQAERQQQEPNGDDPPEPPALWIIDPTRWEGVSIPPREWIVQDMVPAKTVSLLMGDGAAGKTTLALQLATARALGKDWIGTIPNAGRTLFLSAEDDADELHRRLNAVRAHYSASFSDLADLRLVDLVGQDAVLGELQRNGTIKATPLFDAVSKQIGSYGPDFVIIDALADAFAGDENNRTQARQFIGLLKKLARQHGTAFLCLAHPSLYGMNSGSGTSGSTGWSNSVRSRLYFETVKAEDGDEPDPDLRQLSLKKTNYGPVG